MTLEPKPLARRVGRIESSLIRMMPVYAQEVPGAVSLGQGIPPFPLPEHVAERLAYAITHEPDVNRYTLQPGWPPLREAVTQRLNERGMRANINEVYISAGSMAGINQAVGAIVDEGDEVILTNPHYEPYRHVVLFYGGVPKYVPLSERDNWKLDPERLKGAVSKKTKLIVVNTPANPTGNVFSEAELRELARIAIEHNAYVLVDEAYSFLTYDGARHFSMAAMPELKDLLVTLQTFSKEEAMTGFRVAYVHTNERLLHEMLKIHDIQSIAAPTPSQFAAFYALTGPQEHVERFRRELDKRRMLMCERLDRLPDLFEYQKPHGAYYMLPRFHSGESSADFAARLLYEAGVVTIPGEAFGSLGQGHVRMSFAASTEEINEAFDRIEGHREALLKAN